ncbi:hypothetical protein BS47DRAFT_1372048 [Hydnum rufescens UP504]|uniref:CxC2-like cysteine cluster KDZ transposase-associated domain-containing protein n=1 Tax=Hydnum rufescens UP504 TaxID=1448309 RepID=A0A9P6B0H5_9AGAM|nr:hypothetical protein BS47DRAFT_1372048 [Hydnum rufescens UP504]
MDWVPCRQEYLDSLLFLEGRGEALVITGCPLCWEPGVSRVYRCNDCLGGALLCCKCTLAIHENLPLHNIRVWTGQMFEHASLRGLGLTVQLGHPVYQKCPVPVYASSSVRVTFCGCSNAPHHHVQLLHRRWFLSMVLQPKSCATFKVLHQYQLLSLSSKISIHHFYDMLECLTDNTGLVPVLNKYKSFCQMVPGCGNDPSGVLGTASGELAVICPACPSLEFLYDGIYAIDANFCLKNHAQSSVDPGLGTGWAYFVDDQAYSTYLLKHTSQKDISSCSGFAALDHANTKKSDRLRVTGVGAVVCARHGLLRPNSIGDLQKGEQFCNMDYIMFSSLQGTKLGCIMISYDIFCQWITKLHRRLPSLPRNSRLTQHYDSEGGHAQFSLNWMPGIGQTDGEGIERDWSGINPAANSTKEMGSGCRHDTLDDIWSDLNYQKIMMLDKLQAQIHLELIEMERDSLYHGSVSLHDVSASVFVIMGLDIEDTQ